jgi:CBS domain-containing protein
MPDAFNFSASPFDCLSADERHLVRNSLDVAYYREGEVLLAPGMTPTHLFVIIKGHVTEWDGEELVSTYGPDDCFDGRSLLAGKVSDRFVAAEEVVTYELRQQAVTELIASNASFSALLFSDLGHKLGELSQRQSQHELQSLTLARVDQAFMRPAHQVEASDDVVKVVRLMQAQRTSAVLVRDSSQDPPLLGVFTNSGLQKAILDGRPLDQLPVAALANFPLITVAPSDQLGDAMALMLSRRVHRVVVVDGERVLGFLEALDLFSFLSNHSHLISVQIEQAQDLEALSQAASQITRMITLMQRSGMRVTLIARLVQQLNAQLFEHAWKMIAPPELIANSCLFVMGSEGRGEQLLKTDQDNGLILRDGYQPPDNLAELCERFSRTLSDFGYPECPGRIMVSNADWRAPLSDFSRQVREWLILPDPDSLMKLAIFMDAHAVCGDPELLEEARLGVLALAPDNEAVIGRFASAITAFGESQGWWNKLFSLGETDAGMDIKKEGIFPLVHGIRSLALARRRSETGTAARIAALVADGTLDAKMGAELTESLSFFMDLKLKAGLKELDTERPVTGRIDPDKLSSLERDLLKDTLAAVKRFKALLRHRFHLDAM